MPIPILLAGLGVAAGVLGAGGHLSAKETNEKAQQIAEDAKELYNSAKNSLEMAQSRTEQALLNLGYAKKKTLDCSMRQFLDAYDKIKSVVFTESEGLNEITKFSVDQQDVVQLREMTDIYSSALTSGASGAAAGAIVALAASGALPVVSSELAVAGAFLGMGEIGGAIGIAGSALSFGAAMTPLAAIAAPVVLFTGISASLKADENLEKAQTMYAEAEVALEKMKTSETLCYAIAEKSDMFNDLLAELDKMFSECTALLSDLVRKKEGSIFKKQITSRDFSENELKLIAVTRSLAGAVKAVIDTPILNSEGIISEESQSVYDETSSKLLDFSHAVEHVKRTNYNKRLVAVKQPDSSNVKIRQAYAHDRNLIPYARNVLAFVLGVSAATFCAKGISSFITAEGGKTLGVSSLLVNGIAVWLVICSTLVMLIAKFESADYGKIAGGGAGVGIAVLYFEYFRAAANMEHYIIFNVIFLFIIGAIGTGVEKIKDKYLFGTYLYHMWTCVICYPMMFLIYAALNRWLGIPHNISFWSCAALSICGILGVMTSSEDQEKL